MKIGQARAVFFAFVLATFGITGCDDGGGGGDACGNGEIDGSEACDGIELGGATCASLGLGDGTLTCADDCTLNVTGCEDAPDCGNSTIEFGEECDGTDLGGEDCMSLGYDSGDLSCTDECSFDRSGCEGEPAECGDGVINGTEECDEPDFGDATCETLGFGPGTLGCDECGFDTTACGEIAMEYEFLITDTEGQVQGYEADDGSVTLIPLGFELDWETNAIIGDGAGAFMVVGGIFSDGPIAGGAAYSPNGITWNNVSPDATLAPNGWCAVAYGAGTFVVSSCRGATVFFTTDAGVTWAAASTTDGPEGDIVWGDDRFVSANGYSSTDGDSWTAPTTPPTDLTNATIAFGDGRFVVLGRPGGPTTAYYSDDGGDNWVAGEVPFGYSAYGYWSATYGNGRFVVADDYSILYSDDGATWVEATCPDTTIDGCGVAYHSAAGYIRVSGMGFESEIWNSADGMTWTLSSAPEGQWFYNVTSTEPSS